MTSRMSGYVMSLLACAHIKCMPAGFYGGDCSLSLNAEGKPQLLSGLGYQLRRRKPSIYVYELPPSFNTYFNLKLQDRPLWFMIYQVWVTMFQVEQRMTLIPYEACFKKPQTSYREPHENLTSHLFLISFQ